MEKKTYKMEEIILAMVDIALENQALTMEDFGLREGRSLSVDDKKNNVKR